MLQRIFIVIICFVLFFDLIAQGSRTGFSIDSLPPSEIDIPIQVNLRPFFAVAEANVDTHFTSPDYPLSWIQPDCATRYKYYFRRSPLRLSGAGRSMNILFTGYYRIIGSTRVCVKGTVVSPWTPECKCGFSEGERKVTIGFNTSFWLSPNYILQTKTARLEPKAMDNCTVCFWGQDITKTVMKGLKKELDASKKLMEDSFGLINLRPYMQLAWNKLNTVYSVPNVGYITLNPKLLRMDNLSVKNDLLNINIGITATPIVSFIKPVEASSPVPNLSTAATKNEFNIFLEAALQYDSLTRVMNGYLVNKRIELSEGLIKKHIIIRSAVISGDVLGRLNIKLDFTGSFTGTAYFIGKPVYNAEKKTIEVENLDYDVDTKSFLLNTAKWLFDKKITNELKKSTSFGLSNYYETAKMNLNGWLNKEWTKGIKGTGAVKDLKVVAVQALQQHLLIRTNCTGKLNVTVSEVDLKF
jgi:hypothetical protein